MNYNEHPILIKDCTMEMARKKEKRKAKINFALKIFPSFVSTAQN